ncbi:MAG: nuclear transport factor 2 family protein [Symploca sp. SIO1B1]|nr:nuclear transport factor 2 family protein [Symploca sp. SIO1B1]
MNTTTAITTPIVRMIHAVDQLDWLVVRHEFADTVDVDYTSLAGGEPETMPADKLIEGWQGLLPGFQGTQHLLGPFLVEAEETVATVETHVRAYHYIADAPKGDVWIVAGHYHFRMVLQGDCWVVAAIKLVIFYQEGNLELLSLAQTRAATMPRQ